MKAIRTLTAGPKGQMWLAAAIVSFLCGLSVLAEGYFKLQNLATAVTPAQMLVVSNAPVTVFTTNMGTEIGRILQRTIQNTGTNPVLYLYNTTNVTGTNLSVTNYNGVLAGGQAVRDGKGGILDCSEVPYPVSLLTESSNGTTVAVTELVQ